MPSTPMRWSLLTVIPAKAGIHTALTEHEYRTPLDTRSGSERPASCATLPCPRTIDFRLGRFRPRRSAAETTPGAYPAGDPRAGCPPRHPCSTGSWYPDRHDPTRDLPPRRAACPNTMNVCPGFTAVVGYAVARTVPTSLDNSTRSPGSMPRGTRVFGVHLDVREGHANHGRTRHDGGGTAFARCDSCARCSPRTGIAGACTSNAAPYPGQGSGAGMNRALPEGVKNRPSSCSLTVPEGVRFTIRTGVWIAFVAEPAAAGRRSRPRSPPWDPRRRRRTGSGHG